MNKLFLRKIKSRTMNNKGVLGLETVKSFMVLLLILAVLGFAVIVAMATLNDSNVLAAGSLAKNQSTAVLNNVSSGVASFFGNSGTFFAILAAVVIILAVVLIIVAVSRFGGEAGASI